VLAGTWQECQKNKNTTTVKTGALTAPVFLCLKVTKNTVNRHIFTTYLKKFFARETCRMFVSDLRLVDWFTVRRCPHSRTNTKQHLSPQITVVHKKTCVWLRRFFYALMLVNTNYVPDEQQKNPLTDTF
jgi:hypothetical protein